MLFLGKLKLLIRYLRAGNVTPHFKWAEFDCKDGTKVPKEYEANVKKLAEQLEIIRSEAGNRPIRINSGYRTEKHNKLVGGVPNSYHLRAMAADFTIKGMTPKQVYALIVRLMQEGKIMKGGAGLYKTFVHYDIQGKERFWNKS